MMLNMQRYCQRVIRFSFLVVQWNCGLARTLENLPKIAQQGPFFFFAFSYALHNGSVKRMMREEDAYAATRHACTCWTADVRNVTNVWSSCWYGGWNRQQSVMCPCGHCHHFYLFICFLHEWLACPTPITKLLFWRNNSPKVQDVGLCLKCTVPFTCTVLGRI